MSPADARGMVALTFWWATKAKRDAIADHMIATGVNALHAAWDLFGRAKGAPCTCVPCTSGPAAGTELVVRVLVQGASAEAR